MTTTPTIPPGGDTQLYALSGAGVLSQLTGSSQNTNGYAWVGGILMQWGVVTTPGTTGTVSFATSNVNFPNNCFNVTLTCRYDGALFAASFSLKGLPSKTAFVYTGSTVNSTDLYWVAIGN
jgi:hypothetical protein